MRACNIILLAALVLSFGCSHKKPVVTIDDWWNVDYVKNWCELGATNGRPCVGDPVSEVQDFELALRTFFSADPACHEVLLTSFGGPVAAPSKTASDANSSADWQLMFNFQPGESSQDWTMVHRADNNIAKGQGSPKEIAHSICAIVTQAGGSVVN